MKNKALVLILFIVFSCKEEKKTIEIAENSITKVEENKKEIVENSTKRESKKPVSNNVLLGYYVGQFIADHENAEYEYSDRNKITISIDKIKNDSVFGHSIVSGNNRPFKGVFDSDNVIANVEEPGNDPYDGVFSITLSKDGNNAIGNWIANNKNLKINKRKFDLEKRAFRYDKDIPLFEEMELMTLFNKELEEENEKKAKSNRENVEEEEYLEEGYVEEFLTEDVLSFNPSNTVINDEDVANLSKGDLEVLRNSIFARHGYSFKTKKMRYIFDGIDWYMPVSTDVRHLLTELEKNNIDLIKRYEQHAERYYDSFGR